MRRLLIAVLLLAPAAAHAQGSWANRLVGPSARAQLSDPEPSVRIAAARMLARRGEPRVAVRALLERLAGEDDLTVRGEIYRALARRGDESAIPPLAAHLEDDNATSDRLDRAEAVRAVGAIGSERSVRLLVEWLGLADVGDVAVDELVWIGPATVPHLVRALDTPIASARAARALGRIGDTRAVAPMVGRLRGALPAARIAMIDGLAAIGDERAGRAVARYLDDADPNVVAATLRALAELGGEGQIEAIAALADRGTSEQRAAALRTLMVLSPDAATPRVQSSLREGDAPVLRRAAIDGLLASSAPVMAEPLASLLDGPDAAAAAEALSRIVSGRGVPALLRAARAAEDRRFDLALGLAVRRHGETLPSTLSDGARAHLAGATPTARCLARQTEDSLLDTLRRDLADIDADTRVRAASCALLLGEQGGPLREALARRLVQEQDAMAFRALAMAAMRVGARVDPALVDARWWASATAPEALWLTAAGLDEATARTRERARRAMRRGLRSPDPRTRAGAALALGMASEGSAWRALLAAVEDEHDAVRLAAARALTSLAVPDAVPALEALARVETQPTVREAIRRATLAPGRRASPPFVPGGDVLFLRVSTAPGLTEVQTRLVVDVMLHDGRWLRAPALEGGAVLLPDLPAGLAEVQVRLDR